MAAATCACEPDVQHRPCMATCRVFCLRKETSRVNGWLRRHCCITVCYDESVNSFSTVVSMARKKSSRSTGIVRLPGGFSSLLEDVKSRIRSAQHVPCWRSTPSWSGSTGTSDGSSTSGNSGRAGGAGVIPRLARELRNELPEVKGFSERNIKLMVQFAQEYPAAFAATSAIGQPVVAQLPSAEIGQPAVAQIPWCTTFCSCSGLRMCLLGRGTCSKPWPMAGAATC